jgi:hypothetical protein
MSKLPFTKEFLLERYKNDINEMLDICDWKSTIEDYDICSTVADITKENGVDITSSELLDLYKNKIKSLNITDEKWKAEYRSWEEGVPKIIDMIYEIIEENV